MPVSALDAYRASSCRGVAWLVSLLAGAASYATEPGDRGSIVPDVRQLVVTPDRLELAGKNRQSQLVITGVDGAGLNHDLTRQAKIVLGDQSLATLDGAFVRGVAEGQSEIRVSFGAIEKVVPLVVRDFARYPDVSFHSDILPIFSKLGCNSGGCHGKQAGQNGFKLSVFGFDPRADYDAIVNGSRGRRVFPGSTTHSLIYSKAVGASTHGGGQRMSEDSHDAELLREWLEQGTPWGRDDHVKLAKIEVWPNLRVMTPRSQQQLRVVATYSDGSFRDVTRSAVYTTNQEMIADCDPTGAIETGRVAGEAAITINYMGCVDVARVVIPLPNTQLPQRPEWLSDGHPIDQLAWAKWQQLRIAPSELCDDATFQRRVAVKTTGTLPTSEETRAFLRDDSPQKRIHAIDAALSSEDYVNYWSQRWSDILMVNSKTIGGQGANAFYGWIREQIETNRPYDQWVREIIVASGNSGRVGPVNFYRSQRTAEDAVKTISQAFLGIRMDCAQCHHHPFEKWGQDDFYGLAGYFNGMTRQALDENRELIYHPGHKSTAIPVINRPVATRTLGGQSTAADDQTDPRRELADWLASSKNPFFAKLVANRLWKHLMGRGLVEPEDDFRDTNPPTNPELLEHLAKTLVANNFDLRALMRHIMTSKTFQLSNAPNETNLDDEQTYSHYLVRRVPAEVMLDAICQVTEVPEAFPGHPIGARAIELWDNQLPSYFLDAFGRSLRESPCECGSSGEPTMAQALHLLNAPEIEAKIQSPQGRATRLANTGLDADALINEIALSTVNRPANPRELATGRAIFQESGRLQAIQDFLWVMMNSYDFLFVK